MSKTKLGKTAKKQAKGITSPSKHQPLETIVSNGFASSGNFSDDFQEIWTRSGLEASGMPIIRNRNQIWKNYDEKGDYEQDENLILDKENVFNTYVTIDNNEIYRPTLDCEYEIEDTKQSKACIKGIYIKGWKLSSKVVDILKQCYLERLTTLNLWNAGMNDLAVTSLAILLKTAPAVKTLFLEGNPIRDTEPFHMFITEDNSLQNLSLRNNLITEIGALNIAFSLSKFQSSSILNLNLSFNKLGDEGAKHIAKALRTNRTLACLSLSSNYIGDAGLLAIMTSLKQFKLTHEEVVERRKMMSIANARNSFSAMDLANSQKAKASVESVKDRPNSNKSGTNKLKDGKNKKTKQLENTGKKDKDTDKNKHKKKDGNTNSSTENSKREKPRKSVNPQKGGLPSGKNTFNFSNEEEDLEGGQHPLVASNVELTEGKVLLPGNMSVVCLNLARNLITEEVLPEVLSVLDYQLDLDNQTKNQDTKFNKYPGLIRLYLQGNMFNNKTADWLKIQKNLIKREPPCYTEEE